MYGMVRRKNDWFLERRAEEGEEREGARRLSCFAFALWAFALRGSRDTPTIHFQVEAARKSSPAFPSPASCVVMNVHTFRCRV